MLIKCLKSEKGDKDAGLMRLGTQFYLCGGGEVPPSREELSRVDTVAGRGAAVRWGGGVCSVEDSTSEREREELTSYITTSWEGSHRIGSIV